MQFWVFFFYSLYALYSLLVYAPRHGYLGDEVQQLVGGQDIISRGLDFPSCNNVSQISPHRHWQRNFESTMRAWSLSKSRFVENFLNFRMDYNGSQDYQHARLVAYSYPSCTELSKKKTNKVVERILYTSIQTDPFYRQICQYVWHACWINGKNVIQPESYMICEVSK